MKFFKTIIKNFKVLFRLKTALFAIIFGPLLVIFLIGLAFNSSNAIQLTVGYNAPDSSDLTTEFINNLDMKYTTKSFDIQNDCIKELEHGLVHTCIFFPENFVIENDKENNVTFVVDKSRVNLAYTVIEGISEQIGIKSEELSKGLTETLTNTLSKTGTVIDSSIGSLIKIKRDMGESIKEAQTINNDLGNIKLDVKEYSFSGTSDINTIDNSFDEIKDEVDQVVEEGFDLVVKLNSSSTKNDLNTLFKDLNESVFDEYNKSYDILNNLTSKISDIQTELNNIEIQMKTAKENTDSSKEAVLSLKTHLDTINLDVNSVKDNLEKISRDISSIEITSSNQIVNPINTKIETISSDNNQLVSLLPYLLILIVMFVGLMLSSTLVVVERSSRASFRIFTTPTKDEFFILTTFTTSFIIVIAQLAIVMAALNYFLIDIFTANFTLNALILILATSIFILTGMGIGYLIRSQQGANMTSISIGALFLMLSNFVLPIESIIPKFRFIAQYNPYVLASETLRKSTIFSIPFNELITEISILLAFSIIIFILIIIFQKISKAKYFNSNQHAKAKRNKEKKGIWIKNILVNNEEEFLYEIQKLSSEEYSKFVSKNHFRLQRFIRKELNKPLIAKKIKKLSKKEILFEVIKEKRNILDEIKIKHAKRMKERSEQKK